MPWPIGSSSCASHRVSAVLEGGRGTDLACLCHFRLALADAQDLHAEQRVPSTRRQEQSDRAQGDDVDLHAQAVLPNRLLGNLADSRRKATDCGCRESVDALDEGDKVPDGKEVQQAEGRREAGQATGEARELAIKTQQEGDDVQEGAANRRQEEHDSQGHVGLSHALGTEGGRVDKRARNAACDSLHEVTEEPHAQARNYCATGEALQSRHQRGRLPCCPILLLDGPRQELEEEQVGKQGADGGEPRCIGSRLQAQAQRLLHAQGHQHIVAQGHRGVARGLHLGQREAAEHQRNEQELASVLGQKRSQPYQHHDGMAGQRRHQRHEEPKDFAVQGASHPELHANAEEGILQQSVILEDCCAGGLGDLNARCRKGKPEASEDAGHKSCSHEAAGDQGRYLGDAGMRLSPSVPTDRGQGQCGGWRCVTAIIPTEKLAKMGAEAVCARHGEDDEDGSQPELHVVTRNVGVSKGIFGQAVKRLC